MTTLVSPALNGPAGTVAAAISASYGRHAPGLQAEYNALCERHDIDPVALLAAVAADLLNDRVVTLPGDGDAGLPAEHPAPAKLTAKAAADLAAANLLEARKVAASDTCEEPGYHVQSLVQIAAGWRELAVALASHYPMTARAESDDD